MKIVYFTGTGNSYDVAARLGGDLIDAARFRGESLEDDAVGFVCPVYCGDLPKPIWDFIDRTEIRADYAFAVFTYGGAVGNAAGSLKYRLEKKGVSLDYCTAVLMPDNCIVFPTEKEKQEKELALLPDLCDRIRRDLSERKKTERNPKRSPSFSTRFQWFFLRYGYGIRKKKSIPERCTKCGLCTDCPVGNISLTEEGVRFGDRCVDCFRCIQICPANAIQFGRVKRSEKTAYFNRAYLAEKHKK